jgi:hypothetical protein
MITPAQPKKRETKKQQAAKGVPEILPTMIDKPVNPMSALQP